MTATIKARLAEVRSVVRATFPDYRGRSFRVVPSGKVTFADMHWSGGTRSEFKAVQLDGLKVAPVPAWSPWESPTEGRTVDIPRGILVAEHSRFCGKDCGINIYCNPADLRPMLPPKRDPCPSCGGDGVVEAEWSWQLTDPCQACEGAGSVTP